MADAAPRREVKSSDGQASSLTLSASLSLRSFASAAFSSSSSFLLCSNSREFLGVVVVLQQLRDGLVVDDNELEQANVRFRSRAARGNASTKHIIASDPTNLQVIVTCQQAKEPQPGVHG
jgi:hypothetical protein